MKAFNLTISTILIIVVFLITVAVLIMFFTTNFGESSANIEDLQESVGAKTGDIADPTGGTGKIDEMDTWGNPFD